MKHSLALALSEAHIFHFSCCEATLHSRRLLNSSCTVRCASFRQNKRTGIACPFVLAEKERFLRGRNQLHTAFHASCVPHRSAVVAETCPRHVSAHPSNLFKTNKKTIRWMVSLFGGEGEIRTLERCYPLRDFQSRALDQLRDFSTSLIFAPFLQRAWLLYHTNLRLSTLNFAFIWIFLG